MAASTLPKPVTTAPALLASARARRRAPRHPRSAPPAPARARRRRGAGALPRLLAQAPFDVLRQGGRGPGLGLEGTGEEPFLHRLLDQVPPRRDPDAAAGRAGA